MIFNCLNNSGADGLASVGGCLKEGATEILQDRRWMAATAMGMPVSWSVAQVD